MSFYLFHQDALVDCASLYISENGTCLKATCVGGHGVSLYQTNDTEALRAILREINTALDENPKEKIFLAKYLVKGVMRRKVERFDRSVPWDIEEVGGIYWRITDGRGWLYITADWTGKVKVSQLCNCPVDYGEEAEKGITGVYLGE